MEGRLLAAQVVRVPVLLLLLRVTARPFEMHREVQGELTMGRIWGPWIAILVITVAFVVVGGVVQPLAMAWLGVVAVSVFHQRREARACASSAAG